MPAAQRQSTAPLLAALRKTWLALALAHRLREAGRDVVFVPLAAITAPALIVGAMAEAAGLAVGASSDVAALTAA